MLFSVQNCHVVLDFWLQVAFEAQDGVKILPFFAGFFSLLLFDRAFRAAAGRVSFDLPASATV